MTVTAPKIRTAFPWFVLASTLFTPPPTSAHPMGMVSINHYAGIELQPDSVQVKYLLDFAEIPSIPS